MDVAKLGLQNWDGVDQPAAFGAAIGAVRLDGAVPPAHAGSAVPTAAQSGTAPRRLLRGPRRVLGVSAVPTVAVLCFLRHPQPLRPVVPHWHCRWRDCRRDAGCQQAARAWRARPLQQEQIERHAWSTHEPLELPGPARLGDTAQLRSCLLPPPPLAQRCMHAVPRRTMRSEKRAGGTWRWVCGRQGRKGFLRGVLWLEG